MTTIETGLDLEPIDNALILATPGPWVPDGQDFTPDGYHGTVYLYSPTTNEPVLSAGVVWENAYLIANAPTWLRQMHDEIVRLRGRLALARGEVEGVADEAASFHFIPPTEDDIASLCAGLQIAKRALTE
jgi:hypothetical protein